MSRVQGVSPWVMGEIRADREWSERLEKASAEKKVRVVKRFCEERGYPVHHGFPSGRLVVCH